MKILSIQSAVAYGHVGNSAAVFPLQRIGVEVLPVYTVNFSNHTGYGAWRGSLIAPEEVHDVILGIEERGVLPQIDVVLSGYQGGTGIGDDIEQPTIIINRRQAATTNSIAISASSSTYASFTSPNSIQAEVGRSSIETVRIKDA